MIASLMVSWRARTLRRALGLLMAVIPLAYVTYTIATTGPGLLTAVPNPRYELLAAALGLYAACTALGGLLWREALRVLGHDPGLRGAMRQNLLSAPARYLPGLGGQSVGKIGLAARSGVPARAGLAASALEFIAICASGVLAGFIVLPLAVDSVPAGLLPTGVRQIGLWPAFVYMLVAPLAFSAVVPRLLTTLAARRLELSYVRAAVWLAGISLNWLLVGLSVFLLAGAAFPIGLRDLPVCQLAVVASLLAGLLAPTPMGLGVREGVLAVLFGALVGPAQAALLAVGWRLLNVAADGLCFAIALRLDRGQD